MFFRDKIIFETKLIIQIAFRLEISSKNFIVSRNLFLKQQILSLKSIFYQGIEYVTFNILVDKISVITSKNSIFNGVLTFQVTWLVMKFYLVTERWSISAVWGARLLRFFIVPLLPYFRKHQKFWAIGSGYRVTAVVFFINSSG